MSNLENCDDSSLKSPRYIDSQYRGDFKRETEEFLIAASLELSGLATSQQEKIVSIIRRLQRLRDKNAAAFRHLIEAEIPHTIGYFPENHGGRGCIIPNLNERELIERIEKYTI